MAGELPTIWMSEDPRYSRVLGQFPGYLPAATIARLEMIRQARMLFDGRHRELFLTEGRTQYSFRQVRTVNGGQKTLYVPMNVLRLVAMKSADLLFGKVPLVASDDETAQQVIDDITERSGLHQVLYQAAMDAAVEREAFIEAIIYDAQVYLQQIPNDEIEPIGRMMPDGQYKQYLRRETASDGKDAYLLQSTYSAGSISRKCFRISEASVANAFGSSQTATIDALPDLEQWNKITGQELAPEQATNIPWNTITWIPNLMIRKRPVSDFDGVIELQDTLNAKCSQLALVILKHSQPKLIVPEQAFDEDGSLPDKEVYVARSGDPDAKYLTWDAQLAAALQDRGFILNQILVQTETSPVLLGLKEGAAPDAYRKVRLEAFNSLTKAARRSVYWTEGLRTATRTALMLDATIPGHGGYVESTISVQLRDGIPEDETDLANRLAVLKTADIVDDEWCLEQLISDPSEVEEILARKAEKAKAMTPSILMTQEPGATDRNQQSEVGSQQTDVTTEKAGGVTGSTKDTYAA